MNKLITFAALLAIPALAQTTLHDSMVKHWKTTADFTMAVANKMPAEDYSYSPVAAELSFGQLMIQIASANLNACALAGGEPRPAIPPAIASAVKSETKDVPKDLATKYLSDSFDFCNKAVASMTPEKLDAVVGTTRKMTGFEWLWSYFTHTAHHRGQAEVYLRMKGITPPSYTF